MKNVKIHGVVKVGSKGQIVIPKSARDAKDVAPGDELIVVSDPEGGILMFKMDTVEHMKAFVDNLDMTVKKKKK